MVESPASLAGFLPDLAVMVGILLEWQDPDQLARIWPGRLASGQLAWISHFVSESGTND
jgi:hypothetical protein